jgi:alpha-aminoadipic semialdehyde synthase
MNVPHIGLRREDISRWERRAPLTPREVARLVAGGLPVDVQSSDVRVFDDAAYREAGASVVENLERCNVIFAVKEIPAEVILSQKTYVFFAHVIKGQAANMPMLARLRAERCSLIDYERIVDAEGRRLVFFGRFAGLAGMIDTLWALGKRLAHEGRATPFSALRPAREYDDLAQARRAVEEVGRRLAADGCGRELAPLVVAFAGYGNVSGGAQEILSLLPTEEVAPAEVAALAARGRAFDKVVYKTVLKEEHLVEPAVDGAAFDLADYYDFPAKYRPALADYLPYLTVLVNCIYWDPRYPRFVTKADLAELFGSAETPRLRVIGDISCDVEGGIEATVKATGIEATVKATDPEAPLYVYDVDRREAVDGVAGRGPVILAVFNLPAELPVDASEYFGRQLEPFVAPLARADWANSFGKCELPDPIARATILYRGEFTAPYQHLERYLK